MHIPATVPATERILLAEDVPTLRLVSRFLADAFQTAETQPPFATDVLRAFVHAGGAVHYASEGDGVIGASVLLFREPASRAVYSMIAAARTSDHGVGFALKHAQRAWALERGATSMIWTFDPLVSRNAHFNLAKLGATATAYAVDLYGQIDDGVNGHDETDRLTVVWPLVDPHPVHVAGPDFPKVDLDPRLAPDGVPFVARDETGHWCRVPLDIVTIRRQDQSLAAKWRVAVRDALVPVFDAGFTATGFSRSSWSGWYHLTRKDQL